jgi:hypothetical protein
MRVRRCGCFRTPLRRFKRSIASVENEERYRRSSSKVKKAAAVHSCMNPYNEIRENAAHTLIALLTPAFGISSKGSPGQQPHLLGQFPIDSDSCFLKKELTNVSLWPGAAIDSARTGAAVTRVPRWNAAYRAVCAAKLNTESSSYSAITTLVSTAVVIVPSSRATIS